MEDSGLYIHVPFCRGKCPYCGFYSIDAPRRVTGWLDALTREAEERRGQFGRFDTLYLGGGTPSILSGDVLYSLLKRINACFEIAAGAEISIEANPGDVTAEKALELKQLGFNRISLGVQSFDDRVLSSLGRRHTADAAKAALARLRDAGFANVGIDLIYGTAGQSPDQWRDQLSRALTFSPEHISCYELTIEGGTPFGRRVKNGERLSADEKTVASLFMSTSRLLESRGYVHYEISNFAMGQTCRSRHNSKYWRHVPYLGLGPSAHSFLPPKRWWNVRSVRRYRGMLAAGEMPVEGSETLTREQVDMERISLGLRTREGFDLKQVRNGPGMLANLGRLVEHGAVRLEGDRVVPTLKGFAVADALPHYIK